MFEDLYACRKPSLRALKVAMVMCAIVSVSACVPELDSQEAQLTDAAGDAQADAGPGDGSDAEQGADGSTEADGSSGSDTGGTDSGSDGTDSGGEQVCEDPDGDGYGVGALCAGPDCDQGDAQVSPGQEEACNEIDDNCDGVTDEGCLVQRSCADNDGACPSDCYVTTDNDCTLDCRDDSTWPPSWVAYEDEVLRLTNQQRTSGASCGSTAYPPVPALTTNAKLREAARCHTVDMAENDFMGHTSSNGDQLNDRVEAAGYLWRNLAENVAAGASTPAVVVPGWMNSHGHCVNIMRDSLEEIGVGYVFDSTDALHYENYWTQAFGTQR